MGIADMTPALRPERWTLRRATVRALARWPSIRRIATPSTNARGYNRARYKGQRQNLYDTRRAATTVVNLETIDRRLRVQAEECMAA